MAEVALNVSIGAEIHDGFKAVNQWCANNVSWLDDVQAFYRERSAIEKEYSQKLSALAKKYFEKKSKRTSELSVGNTPTVTPGSLESASMTTWSLQLTTLEKRAEEHDRFANSLLTSLAEPLRSLAMRSEDVRKQHADYAAKLEKERDSSYADLKKTKGKYDSICQEVENRRKKAEGSFDKTKAQTHYQQQLAEMRNAKNTYLISINVTNKQKERYYNEYVPEVLDSLQALSESRTSTLNTIWLTACKVETETLNNNTQLISHLSSEIPRNNPVLDSMMFARHNAPPQWVDPADFVFEPSPVWLDDSNMAIDAASKTFLMNILAKSKSSLIESKRESEMSRKEVDGADRVRQAIRDGRDQRDEVEVIRAQFRHREVLHEAERKKTTAEVEVFTITAVVGDISRGAQSHAFHNQTFKIPTNCDLCGDRIWGLSAKGLSCERCGFTCHNKCELKVAADCPGELGKEDKKKIKGERQAAAAARAEAPPVEEVRAVNGSTGGTGLATHPGLQRSDTLGSMNTLSSGYAASAQRSVSGATARSTGGGGEDGSAAPPAAPGGRRKIAAPPPSQYASPAAIPDSEEPLQHGKMLYTYTATGDGEISIAEGQDFTLSEPDDGSGWIKVKPSTFGSTAGLVPASYAELAPPQSSLQVLPTRERPISTASTSTTSLTGSDGGALPKPKKQGPAVAPRRGAKKVKHVEALYAYSASGPGETDMEAGEKMVLVQPDQGDGWCEVESLSGRGVVPAGWVKEV